MKLLFLCTTEFQLMTALNIKYHLHPSDEADIIVDNYHGKEKELAERIRQTKLFSKVFYVRSSIENETLHKFFKEMIAGETTLNFIAAAQNSIHFSIIKLLQTCLGVKYYILNMISPASELDLSKYDFLFIYGTKPIASIILEYISKFNQNCRINFMDEGFGIPLLGKYTESEVLQKINKCYTYASDIAMPELPASKKYTIPSIKRTDNSFINILNHIFHFAPQDIEDYRNSIIFFNPNGGESKMPKYLKFSFPGSKILLQKLHDKHLKEEKRYYRLLDLANFVINFFQTRSTDYKIWMKLNPRASTDQIHEYQNRTDIHLMKRWELPWELLALNSPLENNIFLTDCSGSVCLCRNVVEPLGNNIRRILLYRLAKERFSPAHERFFDNLKNQNDDLFIPETIDELDCIVSNA